MPSTLSASVSRISLCALLPLRVVWLASEVSRALPTLRLYQGKPRWGLLFLISKVAFFLATQPSRLIYLHCKVTKDLPNRRWTWKKYFFDPPRFVPNRVSKKYFSQNPRPIAKSELLQQWRYTKRDGFGRMPKKNNFRNAEIPTASSITGYPPFP